MDVQQTSRFADRVLRLLERVEYRRADSPADKAAIYRLRHDAYMRAGTVEPRPTGMFHDAMDEKDNAWLIGLFIDGDLAGALRLHISASVLAPLPEFTSFSDLIEPYLAAGQTLIDGSRFVSKLEFSLLRNSVPYDKTNPSRSTVLRRRLWHCRVSCGASSFLSPIVWRGDLVRPEAISALQASNGLGGLRLQPSARKNLRAIPVLSIDAGRTSPSLPQVFKRRGPGL